MYVPIVVSLNRSTSRTCACSPTEADKGASQGARGFAAVLRHGEAELAQHAEEHGVGSGAETPGHDDKYEGDARGGGERVDSQRGGLSTLAEGSQKARVRVSGAR